MPKPRALRVFLSYSSIDRNIVRALYRKLRSAGYDVWFDRESLRVGDDWPNAVHEALTTADVAIMCLSEAGIKTVGYFNVELNDILARAKKSPLGGSFPFPLRLDNCEIPKIISDTWHSVPLYEKGGYQKLLHALEGKAHSLGISSQPLYSTTPFLHHVSLPVRDLDKSAEFYTKILKLKIINNLRPFKFPGTWLCIGTTQQHLHLVFNPKGTFRAKDAGIQPRDSHFAVHVVDYFETIRDLQAKGYNYQGENSKSLKNLIRDPFENNQGFLQSYILDPDRHVVEITAHVKPVAGPS